MREDGLIEIFTPDASRPLEKPTVQCVHCGAHFIEPRFEKTPEGRKTRIGRGYCKNCGGFICGKNCLECVPLEKQLDIMEGTRKPDAVSVGWSK